MSVRSNPVRVYAQKRGRYAAVVWGIVVLSFGLALRLEGCNGCEANTKKNVVAVEPRV